MTLTAEEVERALHPVRPRLRGAAEALEEAGHKGSAEAVNALGSIEDKDRALAHLYVALEHAEPDERDLALLVLYNLARSLDGEQHGSAVVRLAEIVEFCGDVWGLPGEEDGEAVDD